MKESDLAGELLYFGDSADNAMVAPAVKEIILDGDYLVVGIDISCPRREIFHCLSILMENYLDH